LIGKLVTFYCPLGPPVIIPFSCTSPLWLKISDAHIF
jgi:hypothetical protein